MNGSIIENDTGRRAGVRRRDDEFSIEHAEGEAGTWEREEHMGLELRKEERK